jgi:hypothetical protein
MIVLDKWGGRQNVPPLAGFPKRSATPSTEDGAGLAGWKVLSTNLWMSPSPMLFCNKRLKYTLSLSRFIRSWRVGPTSDNAFSLRAASLSPGSDNSRSVWSTEVTAQSPSGGVEK